ncbi:MAG: hypothetical protein R3F50_18740 [Gammaproteobacteria bacterium]
MKNQLKFFAEFAEIVGVLGIIASLLFVGLQLSFDRKLAVSTQYQNRSEIAIEFQRSNFENNEFVLNSAERWEKERPVFWNEDIEELMRVSGVSMEYMVQRFYRDAMSIYSYDNNYFQFRNGLLDEDAWTNLEEIIRRNLRSPLSRATYHEMRGLHPEFKKLLIELESELGLE